MQSELQGIAATRPLRFRVWDGVVADVWHARGEAGGGGHYISPHPRLVMFLDDGADAVQLTPDGQGAVTGIAALYVPAQMPLRSRIAATRSFAHLDLHLDAGTLHRRMAALPLRPDLGRPVLRARAPRLDALAAMIAAEVEQPTRPALMLDGLLTALLAEVFDLPAAEAATRGGLSPHQIAAVTRHMQAHLARRISVAEMAAVAGLSESWFAHAFKQATGLSPQRWQMQQRVDAASDLLRQDARPLADIAAVTGFADQAHLTRAFRAATGLPPAAWRRAQGDFPAG